MQMNATVTSPDDPALDALCRELAERADAVDASGAWPVESLRLFGEAGVHAWFLEPHWGGQGWSEVDLLRGYLRLAASCLTTTFILTQRVAGCRRIADSEQTVLQELLLPDLVSGLAFITVGISHLTTSRRHLAKPVLRAEITAEGFRLEGFSPWVTGGAHAEHVVVGATLSDGQQILVALPTDLPGVSTPAPAQLVGLNASHTGSLICESVEVDRRWLLEGPTENVMALRGGSRTGGLQTSALAVGLATAAINFLNRQAEVRLELEDPAGGLDADRARIEADLLALASGEAVCTGESIRARANSLALRATQAALAAAKGTGYVQGHPAGRWCREALFFLVWSCPQPVLAANLCELAGLGD